METPTFDTMDKITILKSFPKFSGKAGENFTDFCSSFSTKLKTLVIEYIDAIELFPACLEGHAAERYLTLVIPKIEENVRNAKTVWMTMLDLMAQALAKPYQNEVAQEQLNARRIQRLVTLAYSASRKYTDDQRKAEVVKYFVRGLNMPLEKHVKRLKKTDPETLLQEAHLEEEMQKQLARERLGEALAVNMIREATNETQNNNGQNGNEQRMPDNRPRNIYNNQNFNGNRDQNSFQNQNFNGNRVQHNFQRQNYRNGRPHMGKTTKMVEKFKESAGLGFEWWNDLKTLVADVKITVIIVLATIGGIGILIYLYPWIAPICGSCLSIRRRRMARRQNRRIIEEIPLNIIDLRTLQRPPSYSFIPPVYHMDSNGKSLYINIKVNGYQLLGMSDMGAAGEYISKDFAN